MRLKPYLEYKDSGVEYLGKVPDNWRILKFKHFYTSSMGNTILKEDLSDNGNIPVYSATEHVEILGYIDTPNVLLYEDDFIIPARGNSIGHVKLVQEECTCTQTTIYAKRLRGFAIDTKYLYWYQIGLRKKLYEFDNTAIPQLTVKQVKENPVLVPLPEEQQSIAAFLDHETSRIDALIQKKEQMIELLKEKRIALITQAVTKGLDPNVKMKDSGIEWLGEVPENWAVKRLRFLVKVPLQYGAIEAAELDDPDLPRYIRITDIDEKGNLREDGIKTIPLEKAKPYMLNDGDLLLARSGATAGKTLLYKETWGAAAFAGYLIRATFNELVLPDFASYYTSSQIYTSWLNMVLIQATIQNISAEKYKELSIPVPSICEQRRIVDYLRDETNKFDMIMNTATHSISLLHEYRSSLIHSAVTGKIDLRGYNE